MGKGGSAGGCGGGGCGKGGVKPGDWTCPSCGDNVFASRDACRHCGTEKPSGGGKAGGKSFGKWNASPF